VAVRELHGSLRREIASAGNQTPVAQPVTMATEFYQLSNFVGLIFCIAELLKN
jgi:hypothetical protein